MSATRTSTSRRYEYSHLVPYLKVTPYSYAPLLFWRGDDEDEREQEGADVVSVKASKAEGRKVLGSLSTFYSSNSKQDRYVRPRRNESWFSTFRLSCRRVGARTMGLNKGLSGGATTTPQLPLWQGSERKKIEEIEVVVTFQASRF